MEVSRLLWGLAVLDHLPKPAAVSLYTKLGTLPLASLTAESLDQILQVPSSLALLLLHRASWAVLCCAVLCCACNGWETKSILKSQHSWDHCAVLLVAAHDLPHRLVYAVLLCPAVWQQLIMTVCDRASWMQFGYSPALDKHAASTKV